MSLHPGSTSFVPVHCLFSLSCFFSLFISVYRLLIVSLALSLSPQPVRHRLLSFFLLSLQAVHSVFRMSIVSSACYLSPQSVHRHFSFFYCVFCPPGVHSVSRLFIVSSAFSFSLQPVHSFSVMFMVHCLFSQVRYLYVSCRLACHMPLLAMSNVHYCSLRLLDVLVFYSDMTPVSCGLPLVSLDLSNVSSGLSFVPSAYPCGHPLLLTPRHEPAARTGRGHAEQCCLTTPALPCH